MFDTKFAEPKHTYAAKAFHNKPPGSIVTYEQIAEQFPGADFDRDRDRAAILKVRDRLLTEQQRAIVAVRGVGYKVITAAEHYRLAQDHRLSARRKTHRSLLVASNYRRDEVTPDVAEKLDRMASRMADLERRLTRQERKTDELQRQVQSTTRRQSESEANIEERMTRLERLMSKVGAA